MVRGHVPESGDCSFEEHITESHDVNRKFLMYHLHVDTSISFILGEAN